MSAEELEHLVHRLEDLATQDDGDAITNRLGETQRARLHDALQRLVRRTESPHDVIYQIVYSPNLLIVAEVASNLHIFQTLAAAAPRACSCEELAAVTNASVELTGRICRWLAGHGMADEAEEDNHFVANRTTKSLSRPGFQGGIKHYAHTTLPPLQALPDFLETSGHANPSDLTNCPFQRAMQTSLTKFEWQKSQPELSSAFGVWMAAQHKSSMSWMDVVDFPALIGGMGSEAPLFVDVGGGIGHQCQALRARYPELTGKVVLQDSGVVLEKAAEMEWVERMDFDFWGPQVVEGARAYYFRYIMHDYPDDKCQLILSNTLAAMADDSVILVDDVVLPDRGAHSYSLDKDIVMMVNFGAMERTSRQWASLFESCGLEIVEAKTYNPISGEAVQVLKKRKAA